MTFLILLATAIIIVPSLIVIVFYLETRKLVIEITDQCYPDTLPTPAQFNQIIRQARFTIAHSNWVYTIIYTLGG